MSTLFNTFPPADHSKLIITGLSAIIGLVLFIVSYRIISKQCTNSKANVLFILAIIFTIIGLLPTLFLFLLLITNKTSAQKF